MEEQVFFNVPLVRLEPIFKRWMKDAQTELHKEIIKEPEPQDKWLDLNDLVSYDPAKRTKATWYGLIAGGSVPHHKSGKHLIFLKSEIDAWLKQGRKKNH